MSEERSAATSGATAPRASVEIEIKLYALADNLGDFRRTLVTPDPIATVGLDIAKNVFQVHAYEGRELRPMPIEDAVSDCCWMLSDIITLPEASSHDTRFTCAEMFQPEPTK